MRLVFSLFRQPSRGEQFLKGMLLSVGKPVEEGLRIKWPYVLNITISEEFVYKIRIFPRKWQIEDLKGETISKGGYSDVNAIVDILEKAMPKRE